MRFDQVTRLLRDAVAAHVTPAATVEVGTSGGLMWNAAAGALTYASDAPPCDIDTIFDLASLTKVIATATLAMRACETDSRLLDTRIADLEQRWTGRDRADATVRHLLEHASGLPAHVKLFDSASGRHEFLERIAITPLAFAPGTRSEYSDLGFIMLGMLLEARLGAPLDELFRSVSDRLDGPMLFRPPSLLRSTIAPTEVDTWRGRLLQGEVHDENCAAIGGVAGHAGLFGTARAVGSFAQAILRGFQEDSWLGRRETLRLFTQRSTVAGSSRALGWDTMLPTSSCGTQMSAHAFGHTGFTGTSLWIDPERDVYVVLLTNRVHPSRLGDGIQPLRRNVHDAVITAMSAPGPKVPGAGG